MQSRAGRGESCRLTANAVISIHRQRCVFGIGWTFPLRCGSGVRFWEVADVAERLLDKLLEDSFEVVEPVSFFLSGFWSKKLKQDLPAKWVIN